MFEQRRPPVWALIAVAVLVLVGVSSMAHGAGWSDGYQMGLLASGGKVSPQMLHQAGWGYHHGGFGGFFGGFFRFLFFLFFLGLIAKFFGFWRWRMHHGGHGHHHWPSHGPWGQGGPQGTPESQAKPEQPQAAQQSATGEPGANNPQPVVWV